MQPWRRTMLALVAALDAAAVPSEVAAQSPRSMSSTTTWVVARDPFVDLWYHCLAVVGYDGYGPLSLYDDRYPTDVRGEKRRSALSTTLDAKAGAFRAAFAEDSAFEVLHFVPLYFIGSDPRMALGELRRAVQSPPAAAATAAQLIAATLGTAAERRVFVTFIDAVENEWTAFLRDERSSRAPIDDGTTEELRAVWATRFARPLATYLDAMNLGDGVIVVSRAVGSEGRFVRGARGSAIVAVSSSRAGMPDAPLLAAVRELAYPLLDRLHAPLTPGTTRVLAARARDAAAVRAGALVLDATDPQLATEYRRHFQQFTTASSFDAAYPIDPRAEAELREIIAATLRAVATRRP